MNIHQEYSVNQEEVEKLRLENLELKKSLENEEFLHKTLYKQWNELNARVLAKERELKQSETRNIFYKYAFYIILFAIVPAYYFLNSSKGDEKIASASKAIPVPTLTTNETTKNQIKENETPENQTIKNQTKRAETTTENKTIRKRDTVQLPVVSLAEKRHHST